MDGRENLINDSSGHQFNQFIIRDTVGFDRGNIISIP